MTHATLLSQWPVITFQQPNVLSNTTVTLLSPSASAECSYFSKQHIYLNFRFNCNQLIQHLSNKWQSKRPVTHLLIPNHVNSTHSFTYHFLCLVLTYACTCKWVPSSTFRGLMSPQRSGVRAEKLQQHNEMYSFRQIPNSFTAITTNTHLHCMLLYEWHKGYQPTVSLFSSLHDKQIHLGHDTATAFSVCFVIRT